MYSFFSVDYKIVVTPNMKKNEFMIFRTRWYIFFSLCLSLNRKEGGGREEGRGRRGEGKVEGGKGEGSGGGKKKLREVLERVPFLPPHPHPCTEYLCCVALAALELPYADQAALKFLVIRSVCLYSPGTGVEGVYHTPLWSACLSRVMCSRARKFREIYSPCSRFRFSIFIS